MNAAEMYTELILDYYRNPKNFGTLEDATCQARDSNPLCGDIIGMQIKISDGHIADIRYNGHGCAISQASASMLTELAQGKQIEEAIKLGKQEILELLGIELSAVRLKCALLGLKVFKLALYSHLGQTYKE